jgi:ABC-type Fe3+ transport system substrate-binding protein
LTDVLVYAVASRAQTARGLLGAACSATGLSVRLEVYGSGSLYQRLGPRHAPPLPDVILWFGPFAAQAAGLDGLLQPYQPSSFSPAAAHDAKWYWTALDYRPIGVVGATGVRDLADLAAVPGLAMADPERSEIGMSMLLAVLDRARQVEGDVERGWAWWQQRASRGLALAEDESGALAIVGDGGASHALSLSSTSQAVPGLAPIPHAVSVAASSPNPAGAKRLVDWLTSDAASDTLEFSPWRAASNGLEALLSAAPPLGVDWSRENYTAARRRWAESGFGPLVKG